MNASARRWKALALGTAGLVAACGARTGLEIPCIVEAEPTGPAVVVVGDMGWTAGDNVTMDGRTFQQTQVDLVSTVFAPDQDGVEYGLITYPPAMAQTVCAVPVTLAVPIGPQRADDIASYLGRPDLLGPCTSLSATIRVAGSALQSVSNPSRPRLIVLIDELGNGGDCCPEIGVTTPPPGRYPQEREILSVITQLSNDGITTFVIGLLNDSETRNVPADDPTITWMLQFAMAGGSPLPPSGQYPIFMATDSTGIGEAFERLARSACRFSIRGTSARVAGMDLSVGSTTVPRDRAHINGWDWIDEAEGTFQLFGATCTQAINQASGVVFTGGNRDCSS